MLSWNNARGSKVALSISETDRKSRAEFGALTKDDTPPAVDPWAGAPPPQQLRPAKQHTHSDLASASNIHLPPPVDAAIPLGRYCGRNGG